MISHKRAAVCFFLENSNRICQVHPIAWINMSPRFALGIKTFCSLTKGCVFLATVARRRHCSTYMLWVKSPSPVSLRKHYKSHDGASQWRAMLPRAVAASHFSHHHRPSLILSPANPTVFFFSVFIQHLYWNQECRKNDV